MVGSRVAVDVFVVQNPADPGMRNLFAAVMVGGMDRALSTMNPKKKGGGQAKKKKEKKKKEEGEEPSAGAPATAATATTAEKE